MSRVLNLIMPMAGDGKRFRRSSPSVPKALIPVGPSHRPMFLQALSSFDSLSVQKKIVLCVRKEHFESLELSALIQANASSATLTVLEGVTRGPLETAFLGSKNLNGDAPLVVMDCDFWFQSAAYDRMIETAIEGTFDADGGILTFPGTSNRYSYAMLKHDVVVRVAEKDPISNSAIAGAYFFNRTADFVSYTERLLREGLSGTDPEYYLSSLFARMLEDGCKIKAVPVDHYLSYGTPLELRASQLKQPFKKT